MKHYSSGICNLTPSLQSFFEWEFSSGDMFNTPVSLFSHDKFRIAITMIRGCKFDLIANTFRKPNTKRKAWAEVESTERNEKRAFKEQVHKASEEGYA